MRTPATRRRRDRRPRWSRTPPPGSPPPRPRPGRALHHRADDGTHAVRLGQAEQGPGGGEPAALGQLDVDQVGGPAADHLDQVADAEDRLVGEDRGGHAVGDPGQPVEVPGRYRLLDQLDAVQRGDHADRLARRPALVGVEPDGHVGPDCGLDGADAGDVGGGVPADLDLEHVEALGDPGLCGGGQLVGRTRRERHIRADPQPTAAQQAHQRDTEPPRGQVMQGDVDGGDRARVAHHGAGRRPAGGRDVVGIAADQQRGEDLCDTCLGAGDRLAGNLPDLGCLAVAGVPVGVDDLYHQRRDGGGLPQRGDERRVQGRADPVGTDVDNRHIGHLT